MDEKRVNRWLNKRGPKTFIMTLILFVVGVSSYLVEKTLEAGGWALIPGFLLVWVVLYFAKIDDFLFR